MWVMLGEMFPNQIRGSGLAVSGFAQWVANFGISVSFPWMAANIGLPVTYGFYAAAAFISFFFVPAMVHETRGRELEGTNGGKGRTVHAARLSLAFPAFGPPALPALSTP